MASWRIFLYLHVIVSLTCPIFSLETSRSFQEVNEVQKMTLIREYLMKMNKPAEKTIKSPDGDFIDCVLFHNQPAFYHPLLKEKILMELPKVSNEFNSTNNSQLWNSNGETCPDGTIPIRRVSEEEVSRYSSLENFGKKIKQPADRSVGNNEFAVGSLVEGGYHGAQVEFNLWAPHVSIPTEFSLTSTGLISFELNAIEAGWIVYPKLFNDNQPRLFTYWRVNSSTNPGCYNLLCSGFVHTNPHIALGAALRPISVYGRDQLQITLIIEKDTATGNWKLFWGTQRWEIGYWPSQLLPGLKDSADIVYFGGEVYNSNSHAVHTTTQMGSGHFPREGYRRAAYIGNLKVFGPENKPISLDGLRTEVSNPSCYDAYLAPPDHDPQLGVHFLYGGPGKGPGCP